jgi:hypothetical protein
MKKLVVALAIVTVTLGSCKKHPPSDCFKSTGKITEQERDIGNFNTIILNDNVNLHLSKGNENKLSIKAGKNLIKKIVTEIKDDTCLVISNLNSCNWVRSYKPPVDVYLTFKKLFDIEYHSTGNIDNNDTLNIDSLAVNVREGAGNIKLLVNAKRIYSNIHRGTATIEFSGNTWLLFVYSADFGLIDNRYLNAQRVYLRSESGNDIYVRAQKSISATINGIGNVYYYGNPQSVFSDGTGSGKLIHSE